MQEDKAGAGQGYAPPVDRLLRLGDPREMPGSHAPGRAHTWPDYRRYGLGPAQIPDLIRLAGDEVFNRGDPESREVWGPLHAWRALGQLRAEEAIAPLLDLLSVDEDDDWTHEELPEVFALIGPAAVPALAAYLADGAQGLYHRSAVARALQRVGEEHPEARDACVRALADQLALYKENGPELNAYLISSLVDLKATEAAPLMREAFAANAVDLLVMGDWDDVRIALGLLPERIRLTQDPPGGPRNRLARSLGWPDPPPDLSALLGAAPRSDGSGQKAGTGHKSRKGNKKRR